MKITMRSCLFLCLTAIILSACKERKSHEQFQKKVKPIVVSDTIIGTKSITDELAGSAYRKRAKSYFIIVKNDTSDFKPIFDESKEGGKVGLDLDLPYLKRSITYQQIIHELKLVLPAARKDFNFDSLNSISYGRLILSGDLAVYITKEFGKEFGLTRKIKPQDYDRISEFLKYSRLGDDLNAILSPYNLVVDKVYPEKVFLTTKSDLFWASKITTDSTQIPAKILDCMVWVKLKKKKKS